MIEDWIKNKDKPAFMNKIVSIFIRVVLLENLVIIKADNMPTIIGIVANALDKLKFTPFAYIILGSQPVILWTKNIPAVPRIKIFINLFFCNYFH